MQAHIAPQNFSGATMSDVRAKFRCDSITKVVGWAGPEYPFLFNYSFSPVYGNSPENKEFFAATPSGEVKLGSVKADLFVPGKEYYIDFTEAPALVPANG
jgi:hypothetical protein